MSVLNNMSHLQFCCLTSSASRESHWAEQPNVEPLNEHSYLYKTDPLLISELGMLGAMSPVLKQ